MRHRKSGVDTSESSDRILIYGQSLNQPNGIDFSNKKNKLDDLDFELGQAARSSARQARYCYNVTQ